MIFQSYIQELHLRFLLSKFLPQGSFTNFVPLKGKDKWGQGWWSNKLNFSMKYFMYHFLVLSKMPVRIATGIPTDFFNNTFKNQRFLLESIKYRRMNALKDIFKKSFKGSSRDYTSNSSYNSKNRSRYFSKESTRDSCS